MNAANFALSIAIAAVSISPDVSAQLPPSDRIELVLRIQDYKQSYVLYEPVVVRCHVENPTAKAIRATAELSDGPASITISITRPDGTTQTYRGRGAVEKPVVEELQEPGMAKVAHIDLDWNSAANDWAFPVTGSYRVVARLCVGKVPDPVYIESNTITIDVHEPWNMDAQFIESFATKDEFARLLREGAAVYCLPKNGPECFDAIERRLIENPTSVYTPILAKDLADAVAKGLIAVTPQQRSRAEQLTQDKTVDRDTLTAMIRAAARARATHRKSGAHHGLTLFEPFFVGDFQRGVFLIGPVLVDPRRLESLLEHFDFWDSTARASLLVTYARAKDAPGSAVQFEGMSATESEKLRAVEANDRARILTLVRARGYAQDWNGFVKAYKRCIARASLSAGKYRAAHPQAEFWEMSKDVVEPIARETGVYEALERSRIEPEDVADEMLRLVREHMAANGLPEDTADLAPDQLFYGCETNGRGTVNVLSWHPLAVTMYRALQSADTDPQAAEIQALFDQLTREFADWLARNRDSFTPARDQKLRELGTRLGIFARVEAYAATQTAPPAP